MKIKREVDRMKRRTSEELDLYYGKVVEYLKTHKEATEKGACEAVDISYGAFISWKRRRMVSEAKFSEPVKRKRGRARATPQLVTIQVPEEKNKPMVAFVGSAEDVVAAIKKLF